MKQKTYITTETFVNITKDKNGNENFGVLIPKNSAIVIIKETEDQIVFIHQGHGSHKMKKENFNLIPKKEKIFTEDFIYSKLIPPTEFKDIINFVRGLKKTYKKNKTLVKWLDKIIQDATQTKGSNAINGKQYNNFNKLSCDWMDGFKAKPYSWNENRSGRTTVSPTDEEIIEWEKDPMNILPIGIKNTEHTTYQEQVKIIKKTLGELCGVKNVPLDFIESVKSYGLDVKEIHLDYLEYNTHIKIEDIDMNTHHGKEKGIEFCHFDPFAGTIADNITLGLSSSNRKQSGNTVFSMGYNGTNAQRRVMNLPPLTEDEYKNLFL